MSLAEDVHQPPRFDSVEAFLDWVEVQPDRWELWDGVARRMDDDPTMMAGGTPNHATISLNAATALKLRLRGGPCRAFNSDLAVVLESRRTFFPDVSVSCEPVTKPGVTHPVVVVEVLSPSTASYDLGEKATAYRRLPSLRHLVFVRQDRIDVSHFHREAADDEFALTEIDQLDGVLALTALNVAIPVAELYELVDFAA